MKNLIKTSLFLSLVMVIAVGCQQKTSTKKKSSSSNTITDPNTDTDTGAGNGNGNGSVYNCASGIYRQDATRCYYADIPRITLNGAGNTNQTGAPVAVIGPVLWSSKNNLPSTYSQNNFVTDATFTLRFKAQYPYGNARTMAGRTCSTSMTNNFSRMKVVFMLRRTIDSITQYVEAEAKVGAYSNKIYFNIPSGTTQPYILEVVGIMTDHRCHKRSDGKYTYGTPANTASCTDGTAWSDIPLNTGGDTSCASFDIEYATDNTYDLPNS